MDWITFSNNLAIRLIWPLLIIILIWNHERVSKIIESILNPVALKVQSIHAKGVDITFSSVEIEKKLRFDLIKLSDSYNESKPFPYPSPKEVEQIINSIRSLNLIEFRPSDITNISILRCFGEYFYMIGDYKEALNYYKRCEQLTISKKRANFDIMNVLGHIYIRLGEYQKALECFNTAKAFKPDSPWPYFGIGLCHFTIDKNISENNLKTAKDIFKKLLDKNPVDSGLWWGLGVVYHFIDQEENAVDCASKAIKIDGNFSLAYLHRASSNIKLKKDLAEKSNEIPEEILDDLLKCISLNPKLKEQLLNDPDFIPIRNTKCFKCVTI